MTSMAPTMGRVGGRLRLAVAGAAVLTALTVATPGRRRQPRWGMPPRWGSRLQR